MSGDDLMREWEAVRQERNRLRSSLAAALARIAAVETDVRIVVFGGAADQSALDAAVGRLRDWLWLAAPAATPGREGER